MIAKNYQDQQVQAPKLQIERQKIYDGRTPAYESQLAAQESKGTNWAVTIIATIVDLVPG
jgi:hypothetical protein